MDDMQAERYQKAMDSAAFLREEILDLSRHGQEIESLVLFPILERVVKIQQDLSALKAARNSMVMPGRESKDFRLLG